MRCAICKKESDQADLFEGIMEGSMVIVCEDCAQTEEIPLIKRPTKERVENSKQSQSVRERMERLSGYRDRTQVSEEQLSIQGNLAKLKNPYKKESHPNVEDNYYWEINMARRRKKLSPAQLAAKTGIESDVIEALEKGILIEGFEEILQKLENVLGIKLLKHHSTKLTFHKTNTVAEEEKILEQVRKKMSTKNIKTESDKLLEEIEEDTENLSKKEKLGKISSGEIDFSKRESLRDVTLNDLVKMKRQREKSEEKRKKKQKKESMIGDDLDIDEV
jgi:ribosome-binding protein aMBF1 (putative translation factor)